MPQGAFNAWLRGLAEEVMSGDGFACLVGKGICPFPLGSGSLGHGQHVLENMHWFREC